MDASAEHAYAWTDGRCVYGGREGADSVGVGLPGVLCGVAMFRGGGVILLEGWLFMLHEGVAVRAAGTALSARMSMLL